MACKFMKRAQRGQAHKWIQYWLGRTLKTMDPYPYNYSRIRHSLVITYLESIQKKHNDSNV